MILNYIKIVYLKMPEVFIILPFQLLITKFLVMVLYCCGGAVLNLSWEVTGDKCWGKKLHPCHISLCKLEILSLSVLSLSTFFFSSSFFLFCHQYAGFFGVLNVLQFCVLPFLGIHSLLKFSNFFARFHHCYFNFPLIRMMFLTFLWSFPQTCPQPVPLASFSYLIEVIVFR